MSNKSPTTLARALARAVARPLKLYAAGHLALLTGAWAMHATGSMLPMALAASACLMLTVPLVRHFMKAQSVRR